MTDQPDELTLMTSANQAERTLSSLAYINVTWEESRTSYLDNFLPLVLEILRARGDEAGTNHDVCDALNERFGLDLPIGVVSSLLRRAVRKRQVRRSNQRFTLEPGTVDRLPDVEGNRAACRREQNALVSGLVEFATGKLHLDWTSKDAEFALLGYVMGHVVPLLALTTHRLNSVPDQDGAQGGDYVVAAYLAKINDEDHAQFQAFDHMIKGAMLASVLYVKSGANVTRRFQNTTLYLDTPVCLQALGHEGHDAQRAMQQMLSLAVAQGARLACFDHTVREMRGVLEGARAFLRAAPGSQHTIRGVAAHFRASGQTPADVDLAIQRLELDLKAKGIGIREPPEYSRSLGVDERSLEDALQQRVHYFSEAARVQDVRSLTAIHRLRRGESGPHLETCKAVFVTTNVNVVRAAAEFFDSGRHDWPIAMLDHDLTTLVWVKEPATAPDLPLRQVMADCYAAMSPSQAMWEKISREIDRLSERAAVSPDDVTLLKYSHEAEQAVMDVTTGDPNRVSQTTLLEALARARTAAAAPERRLAEAALRRAESAERADAANRFEAAQHSAESRTLRARLQDLEDRNMRREAAIRARVAHRAGVVQVVVQFLGVAVVILVVIAGVVSLFPVVADWAAPPATWTLRGAAVVGVIVSGVVLWRGSSVKEWTEDRTANLRRAWERKALRQAGLLRDDG